MILSRKVGDTLRDGLVLDLPLSEKDGDAFMSNDVYGHLCTNHGSNWNMQGHIFNGTSDYVDCENIIDLFNGGTFSAWIFVINTTSQQVIFSNCKFSNTDWINVFIHNGNVILSYHDASSGTYYNTAKSISSGWNHITAVWNANGINPIIYINGDNFNNTAGSSLWSPNEGLFIGRRAGSSYYFNGSINDIRIYNRILSEDKIILLYNQNRRKYL